MARDKPFRWHHKAVNFLGTTSGSVWLTARAALAELGEQKQGLVMDDLRHTARVLLQRNDLGLIDLWILYWNHGGHCHPFDFDAFIYEIVPAGWVDMVALELAVRELSLETIA